MSGLRYSTVPWREIGNGAVSSAALLLAFYGARTGLPEALLAGVSAWAGWKLAVGTDPSLAEIYGRVQGVTPEFAERTMAAAAEAVRRVRAAARAMPGCQEGKSLAELAREFDGILAQLRSDPGKLPKAQRFVSVYMDEVAEAGEKFAKLRLLEHGSAIDGNFTALLDTAKATVEEQRKALVADDELALDIHIEALRKRMTLQGVS